MQLLPLGGTTRLPSLAALGWIIAYYVEFGKIRGTDCHVGALPLLAMTGRGIDKDLKAGIIIDEGRALPVNGGPSSVTRSNRGLGASAVTSFYYLPG